jgi:2',3'-cyclic-nucleotide 2'-phosphodiesterase (5'-nucleotidase family)
MAKAESAHTTIVSITDAHARLIQHIIINKPHHMPGWYLADALDFEDRAEHLRRLLVDVEDYTRAVMVDMARSSNIHVDTDVTGGNSDLKGDVVGTLLNCADDLRVIPSMRVA